MREEARCRGAAASLLLWTGRDKVVSTDQRMPRVAEGLQWREAPAGGWVQFHFEEECSFCGSAQHKGLQIFKRKKKKQFEIYYFVCRKEK